MPAGRYVVAETEYPGVLLVQNSDGRHTAFILTIKAYANEAERSTRGTSIRDDSRLLKDGTCNAKC
ncbi:MAG: hypothetical protein DMF86_24330 [Acidobacteria bacterium]|nr:MAG: hypothetical protein DMF86_24330 [Acidobacteriota bacterium]